MESTRIIYVPSGPAKEYSDWAASIYNGCTNGCDYCLWKSGRAKGVGGTNIRITQKAGGNEEKAYEIFKKELIRFRPSILEDRSNLLFTFTSDCCLPETIDLSWKCILFSVSNRVPITVLTKRADFLENRYVKQAMNEFPHMLTIGFTITYHDELEKNASPTEERLATMKVIHEKGIRTLVSLEPIITIEGARKAIKALDGICDVYKIGLLNHHKRNYSPQDVLDFKNDVDALGLKNLYWKKSVYDYIKKIE